MTRSRAVIFALVLSFGCSTSPDPTTETVGGTDTKTANDAPAAVDLSQEICSPDCEGIECGSDGCGGECGACPGAAPVCEDGLCVPDCTEDCDGKDCGDDGCGGSCGLCDDGNSCTDDSCIEGMCIASVQSVYCLIDDECMPSGTENPYNGCEECSPAESQTDWTAAEDKTPCGGQKVCFEGNCCDPEPACTGKECGDDGCGGQCGECPGRLPICEDGECVSDCVPQCEFKECGPDGCGESCGKCGLQYDCVEDGGIAKCQPDCIAICSGLECGPAGEEGECDCGTCDDGDLCTSDACADATCFFDPNGADCDDGNPCTGPDKCIETGCHGKLLPLEELVVGECLCLTDEDCAALEDGDVCNGTLACDSGGEVSVCQVDPDSLPECDDDNPCTDDECDPSSGCTFTANNDNVCADSNACNGLELCQNGNCEQGAPPLCEDGNPCTNDSCDSESGCLYIPDDGADCSDDNPCNGLETCSEGVCAGGLPPDCDDGDICTADSCDPLIGCVSAADPGACDDGLVCTDDICQNNQCANPVQAFFCLIEQTCVPAGATNPGDACGQCEPSTAIESWTLLEDGIQCGAGKVCFEGACCDHAQNCAGKECGDDDCGGVCGNCPADSSCQDGLCVAGPCEPACQGKECGDDGCGGECGQCPASSFCAAQGVCVCVPECAEKQCGPDGCGDECGQCPEGWGCQNGICVEGGCDTDCVGKECGDDGCGGSCGDCDDGLFCTTDTCTEGACGNELTAYYCVISGGCAPSGAENPENPCEHCKPASSQSEWTVAQNGLSCGVGLVCFDGACCNSAGNCAGLECGEDGCGGSCGPCAQGWSCDEGLCVEGGCEPDCNGKECGPDGCGDICGQCSGNGASCVNGACVCTPDCDGKECGPDGSGDTCGVCGEGQYCVGGECPAEGLECEDGNEVDWDGCTNNEVTEFEVSEGAGKKARAAVSSLANDSFVVLWSGVDANDWGIKVRIFNGDGTTLGEEFLANTYTPSQQSMGDVDGFSNGGFVIVWESNLQDGDGYGVYGRLFDPDGSPASEEFRVNSSTAKHQTSPGVAVLSNGGFVVVFASGDQAWQGKVHTALYDADGNKTLEYQVKFNNSSTMAYPAVTALNDGRFAVVYQAEIDGSGWNTDWGIGAQIFGPDGTAEGDPFKLNSYVTKYQEEPVVAGFDDGGFISAWQSDGQDGSHYAVYGQRVDVNGDKVGEEFKLNSYTDSHQKGPAVAAHGNDAFVATWHSNMQDGNSWGVFGKRWEWIDPVGFWGLEEFSANALTNGQQSFPDVATFSDGSYVIVWHYNISSNLGRVYAQRFDAEGNKLYR